MGGIFISYATADRDAAKAIAGALEAYGWPVWWDRLIPAGRTWREVIDKALGEAGCVLVLWSAAAVASEWVQEEAAEGRRRRVLIPVRIEAVEPPLGFRAIQAADLRNWDGTATSPEFRKLVGDIAALLGPPPAEPALAAPTPAREPRPIGPTKPESERRQEYRRAERELGAAEAARPAPARGRWTVAALGGGATAAVAVALYMSRDGRPPVTPAPAPPQPAAAPQAGPQERSGTAEGRPAASASPPAIGPVFVVAPRGDDGALIAARARAALQAEGFRIAGSRGEAALLIEIAPPVLGPVQASPGNSLDLVAVTVTLEAIILSGTDGAPAAPSVQRQVKGFGAAEAEARGNALVGAADELSRRIAATLR